MQRRSSVSYSHCKVSVASLFLCFTNCSFLRCSLLCYSSFFVVFISVVRLLRHFGLCYALAPLLSRTISGTLSTLVASLFPYFIALLQVAAFFVQIGISLFLISLLPHLNFLFVLVGVPVLELGAQFIQFWSLELNSSCKVFFQPFLLSCFFLNFFSFFICWLFSKMFFRAFPPKKNPCFILFLIIHIFLFILFVFYLIFF